MNILQHPLYQEDLHQVIQMPIGWDALKNTTILISGAAGMIGSFLVDVIMLLNEEAGINCTVIALGRNQQRAQQRFSKYWGSENFHFYVCDVTRNISLPNCKIDYIIHAASNTHPVAYSTDPIGSITTNIIGTHNLLECAVEKHVKRFVFLSSVEIYGENRGDCPVFDEEYCGYINCNTLRAGYPEGKRAGEALCQAYIHQKALDVVIPRLARVYGPTVLSDDSKAMSQFLKKGVAKEDIILKSQGTQFFSYCYVADAVSGIFYCMLHGECGNAYNIADSESDITLKELANLIALQSGTKVVFELPDSIESKGYSKATTAIMTNQKLRSMGWHAKYSIKSGVPRTLDILRSRQ